MFFQILDNHVFILFFDVNVSPSCYINIGDNFMKSEVVHARVQSNVKVESDKVLSLLLWLGKTFCSQIHQMVQNLL